MGVSRVTPGWCLGGRSEFSDSKGLLGEPVAVFAGSDGSLYVTDTALEKIVKIK
jgi:hypothetical protein